MSKRPTVHRLELRVVEVAELFNSTDPTPFADRDAERFLESSALEFPQDSRFRIVVHVEHMPLADPAPLASEAIRNHFDYRATATRRSLRTLPGEGRANLVIGLAVSALLSWRRSPVEPRGEHGRSATDAAPRMLSLLVLFGVVGVLNVLPAFGPPTWMLLSFVGVRFAEPSPWTVALVAAWAATLGPLR